MSAPRSRPSRRYRPTWRTEHVVPVILVLLGLFLAATIAVVVLSLLGLTPSI